MSKTTSGATTNRSAAEMMITMNNPVDTPRKFLNSSSALELPSEISLSLRFKPGSVEPFLPVVSGTVVLSALVTASVLASVALLC